MAFSIEVLPRIVPRNSSSKTLDTSYLAPFLRFHRSSNGLYRTCQFSSKRSSMSSSEPLSFQQVRVAETIEVAKVPFGAN